MDLLELGDVDLEVFVSFELLLHRYDIFCVPNLPFVRLLKVLLELIQLTPQNFTLIFDFIQFPRHVYCIPEAILLYNGLALRRIQIDDELGGVVVVEGAATRSAAGALA